MAVKAGGYSSTLDIALLSDGFSKGSGRKSKKHKVKTIVMQPQPANGDRQTRFDQMASTVARLEMMFESLQKQIAPKQE